MASPDVPAKRLLLACLVLGLVFQMYAQVAYGAETDESFELSSDEKKHHPSHEHHHKHPPKIDCRAACERRCKKASRHKRCIRACGTCCDRCNCVPLGTSGNTHTCPCYANMRTHHNKLKCP